MGIEVFGGRIAYAMSMISHSSTKSLTESLNFLLQEHQNKIVKEGFEKENSWSSAELWSLIRLMVGLYFILYCRN